MNWIDMLIDEIRDIKSSRKDLRSFGLTVGTVLAFIGGFLMWRGKPFFQHFLLIGISLAVSGLIVPAVLKPLHKAWMALAVVMGWFMTRVILLVLFYLVVTPTGLALRLFGKQLLDLRWDKSQNTYWNYRETEELERSKYERQF